MRARSISKLNAGKSFSARLSPILSKKEKSIFRKLSTPKKIQDFLDRFPANFEISGETNFSPIRVLREKTAHCLEGAIFAAAVLAYHGHRPLLMDFQTGYDDEDHVVAVYQQNGFWGAISKTNHSVLRYRDAIYKTPRELAMSYAHEYFLWDGRKSLRAYSKPFDLSKYPIEKWVTTGEDLEWIIEPLDKSPHFPILPKKNFMMRKVSHIELQNMKNVEWQKPRSKRR
jgi:hypothetical protein